MLASPVSPDALSTQVKGEIERVIFGPIGLGSRWKTQGEQWRGTHTLPRWKGNPRFCCFGCLLPYSPQHAPPRDFGFIQYSTDLPSPRFWTLDLGDCYWFDKKKGPPRTGPSPGMQEYFEAKKSNYEISPDSHPTLDLRTRFPS